MSDRLLAASGLGKAYPADSSPSGRVRALLRLLAGRPVEKRWVLRGIGLEVRRGASVGIIGENGAGKSTLLKLLTGVLTPSAGSVERHGSIGALLELGAGFDPERSGRDNIALSAGLMGWTPAMVRERSPEIIAFADIGEYIDAPVKHYSSGMVVRLGFAIIAVVKPDLLITDEVLAVGDESFQKKCIQWMEGYLEGGGTLLLVSHSMYHVQKLCTRALWLKDGGVEAEGDVFDVTQAYLAHHEARTSLVRDRLDARGAEGGELFRIARLTVNGSEPADTLQLGNDGRLQLAVDLYSPNGATPHLGVGVVRADGTAVFGSTSEIDAAPVCWVDPRHVRYQLDLDLSALLPGSYALRLHALDAEAIRLFDTLELGIGKRGRSREFGMVTLPRAWRAVEAGSAADT